MNENDEKNREIDTTGSLVEGSSPQKAVCTCDLNDLDCPEHGAKPEWPQRPPRDLFGDIFDIASAAQQEPNAVVAAEMGLGRFVEASPSPSPVAPIDAVAAFVEDAFRKSRGAFTSTAEIMAAARTWCAEHDVLPFGPRALAAQLKRRRGVQAHSNGQRRGWRGVRLR